ncbi:MAG: hypothetical protein RL328_2242, partial [Acidobacteriota bacterium]
MRLRALCVTALVLAGVASGQAGRGLVLVGNRVAPLKYDGMTPEQRLMADHLMAGERGRRPGGPRGPFNVLMRSPEAGDFAQQFGEVMRFGTGLPKDVSEVIILMTGRYWGAQFEWASHKPAALDAGAKPEILEAIRVGKRPAGMNRDTEIAYNFIDELLTTHQVSDATFGAAKERYGVQGVVDMVGLSGWYGIVSMCLNLDQYPLDPGDKPALGALANPLPVVGAGFATPIPGKPDPVTVRSSANGKEFTLIGDRLRPPTWEQMTAEQKKFTEEALAGRGTGGSFPVSLHSPVMGRQLFGLGERVRFHMSVPDRLKELAILLTAR